MKSFLGYSDLPCTCKGMQKRLILKVAGAEPSNRNQSLYVDTVIIHIKISIQCSSPLASFNYRSVDVAKFLQGAWKRQSSRKAFQTCSCYRIYNIKWYFLIFWGSHAKKRHYIFSNDTANFKWSSCFLLTRKSIMQEMQICREPGLVSSGAHETTLFL